MPLSPAQVEFLDALLLTRQDHDMPPPTRWEEAVTEDELSARAHVFRAVNFMLHDHSQLVESGIDVLGSDAQPIRKIVSASTGRAFWKVPSTNTTHNQHNRRSSGGGSGGAYVCTTTFCTCKSFAEQAKALSADQHILCKHLLAVRLGTALNVVECATVSDAAFADSMVGT